MKNPILKGYFDDIFFEFLTYNEKRDAIIILPGFPSSNVMDEVIYFLYEKGFNVFVPRYKGTYQSKGKFLETNPLTDLIEFVTQLKKGKAVNLCDMKSVSFKIRQVFVFGGSFGGSMACVLATNSKHVAKVVVASPIWDFENHNRNYEEQDLNQLTEFVKRAFQNLYRYSFKSITKEMKRFKESSFEYYKKSLKVSVLVFHDPNDKAVSVEHSREAERNIKNVKLIETDVGHGLSIRLLNKFYPQIKEFLKSN